VSTMQGFDPPTRSACIHEAAHAAVAHVLGARLGPTECRAGVGVLGCCQFRTWGLDPIAVAAIGLAGGIAEEVIAHISLSVAAAGAGRDMRDSEMALFKLPAEERAAAMQNALRLAQRIVSERRVAIEKLADWLTTFGEVGPAIATVILERAAA